MIFPPLPSAKSYHWLRSVFTLNEASVSSLSGDLYHRFMPCCLTASLVKRRGDANQQQHDERQGSAIVPHSVIYILLYGSTEQFDVVHRQQLGNGKGGNRGHENHHHTTHDAKQYEPAKSKKKQNKTHCPAS